MTKHQKPTPSPAPTPTVEPQTNSLLAAVAGSGVGAQSSPNPADPFSGLAAVAGQNGGSNTSTETLLGVGTTGTQKVDTSGLGSLSSASTLTDAVSAFDKLWQTDDSTFQYLQQQLSAAGFYGTTAPTFGVYSQADQTAFVNAAKAASQSGSNLQQYLTTRAAIGLTNGVKALPSDVTVISHPSEVDTDTALENEAKTLTGLSTVPADLLTKFHAIYDSAYVAGQRQAVKEQTAAAANANSTVANGVTDALNRQSSGADSQTAQGWATNPWGQVLASGQASSDASTLNSATNGTLTPQGGLTADITQAPTVAAAADQFLQQNDAPAIGANNAANKYGTLLGILAGKG